MITVKNYKTETKGIDWAKMPEALQSGHKNFNIMAQHYDSNQKIKSVIDLYLQKLNAVAGKQRKPTKKSSKAPASKPKAKTTRTRKKAAPKTPKKSTAPRKNNSTPVERIPDDIRFIKRYVLLNGKVKTKHQILLFISGLQKAILEKRIRKNTANASAIRNIQEQLIKLYNNMPEQVKVEIDEKTIARYLKITSSQNVMLSITYIKRFISLHGKTGVKEKAERLIKQLQKAVKSEKLTVKDPYKEKLEMIFKSLVKYVDGDTPTPEISNTALNGLRGMVGQKQLFKKKSPVRAYRG